jgi:hypothetical protein
MLIPRCVCVLHESDALVLYRAVVVFIFLCVDLGLLCFHCFMDALGLKDTKP